MDFVWLLVGVAFFAATGGLIPLVSRLKSEE
jgi:hypothetical protein